MNEAETFFPLPNQKVTDQPITTLMSWYIRIEANTNTTNARTAITTNARNGLYKSYFDNKLQLYKTHNDFSQVKI